MNNEIDVFKKGFVLSDVSIREMIKTDKLIEGDLQECQFQPNSLDLTLGNTYKILQPNEEIKLANDYYPVIDPVKEIKYQSGLFFTTNPYDIDKEYSGPAYYRIDPQQFALMASREVLNIPNGILSFVQGRSSIARLSIQTEQAGLIDAGFSGTITFEVFNQSEYPIILYEGMRIAQVYFFRAEKADKVYGQEKSSKYHGQIEATGSMIHKDFKL